MMLFLSVKVVVLGFLELLYHIAFHLSFNLWLKQVHFARKCSTFLTCDISICHKVEAVSSEAFLPEGGSYSAALKLYTGMIRSIISTVGPI